MNERTNSDSPTVTVVMLALPWPLSWLPVRLMALARSSPFTVSNGLPLSPSMVTSPRFRAILEISIFTGDAPLPADFAAAAGGAVAAGPVAGAAGAVPPSLS